MNENQSRIKNYILIIKTIHGDPDDNNITVVIKGINGQTERIALGKSQLHNKAFKDNQTDLFLLLSSVDVGKILQVEFYTNINTKFKEWKFNHILIIDGTYVYQDLISEYSLIPSTDMPSVVNVTGPSIESQESIYYAFVKTGDSSCLKESYPKLSLFGNNQKHTEIDMKSSSTNNNIALKKYQFDIFQWRDSNIENIERMSLQLYSENKQTKCQWPIEWIFVIHYGYSFTGRIMLNRTVRTDRFIDMNLEQSIPPIPDEYGDSTYIEKNILPLNILNKQSNATTDDIGRYYVLLRNMEGTSGDVYIEFHGDRLSSSDEQQLLKSENYPDHPFSNKQTDLFHTKALEVGHINSVSIRLDQTTKEHSITLDSLYIIHNAIIYEFDLKNIILNKQQSKKEFFPLIHSKLSDEKVCYYIATHTADRMLSGTNTNFKVSVTGTKGMFGPIELKESLTNGDNPFERECIDLFHIEQDDIGNPTAMTIALEPKNSMPHLFSGAKCDRIMLVKDGEYSSLWQVVGDLKSKEPKTITLPIHQRQSFKDSTPSPVPSVKTPQPTTTNEIAPLDPIEQIQSPKLKAEEQIVTTPIIDHLPNFLSGDHHQAHLTMAAIEDHQKRHTFAPSLYQAQQNYRELRRLLRKVNGPMSKEDKTHVKQKQTKSSNRQ